MSEILMRVEGNAGQLELLADRVRIRRKGMDAILNHGLKGDKDIFIKQISAIQFKLPGTITGGYIHFVYHGSQGSIGSLADAVHDENTVLFGRRQKAEFEQIKEAIESRIAATADSSAPNTTSSLDELEKLANLRDKGIITEDEFRAKKRQLLGL